MKREYLYYVAPLILVFPFLFIRRRKVKIRDISRQLPIGPNGQWPSRDMSQVTDITLHHTASPPTWAPERVAGVHVKRWGYGIAYHYLVYPDGKVYQVNKDQAKSWHNGYNNTRAIGISMVGNYEIALVSPQMEKAVIDTAVMLKRKYPSITNLLGHKELPGASTACPGAYTNIDGIRKKTGLSNPYRSSGQGVARKLGFYQEEGYKKNRADN